VCASYVNQDIRAVLVPEIENRHCLWLCECTLPFVQKLCQSVCPINGIAYPNSASVSIDGCFC